MWARLMNSTLGAGDPDLNPEGIEGVARTGHPGDLRALQEDDRRAPGAPDGRSHERAGARGGRRASMLEEHEIVMGFFLLVAAGNDSTKATYCSGMRALMENPEQRAAAARGPVADPGRGGGVAADVPRVRPLPAHCDVRHGARGPADQGGREGGDVVRLLEPRRVAATRTRTASMCGATPSTRRSARAGGTSAWAPRSRGWS